jgi:hypothetical protein
MLMTWRPDGASLSCPGSSVVAKSEGEAARFENVPAPENIARDWFSLIKSQSLTDKSKAGGTVSTTPDTVALPQFSHTREEVGGKLRYAMLNTTSN